MTFPTAFPKVLPLRDRAQISQQVLAERLDSILPGAMREAGIDMWLVICQEDNHDPVFDTLIPEHTWCPILQILVFHDRGESLERINLSMTNAGPAYDKPWNGADHEEQWRLLGEIIAERDPRRIGINVAKVQWAADGLTHGLYQRLLGALPEGHADRLCSAEALSTRWLATLCPKEIELFTHVVAVAKAVVAECYSQGALVPGVTSSVDLEWHYRQRAADLGLDVSFRPFFGRVRSEAMRERYGPDDSAIRPGDMVHCDVGIRYLGLCSDHQQWAYVLRPRESDAPAGLRALMAQANRLQDIFMRGFERGLTGNELLARILGRARDEGVPGAKVYSHSLGRLLHEPGPLIGLPWEQGVIPGRGDVVLDDNYAFTMELCVADAVPEWGGQEVRLSIEEDVVFTDGACRVIGARQQAFHLI